MSNENTKDIVLNSMDELNEKLGINTDNNIAIINDVADNKDETANVETPTPNISIPDHIKFIKVEDTEFLRQFRDLSYTLEANKSLLDEFAKSGATSTPLVKEVYNAYMDAYKSYEMTKENFKNEVVLKTFPTALNYDLNFNTGIVMITLPR